MPIRIQCLGHVLLVDNEASTREMYRHYIERAGIKVRRVATVAEAVKLLDDGERPAVVVSDVDLPGLSGVDLLRTMTNRWGFIPVILYSRNMNPEMRSRLIGAGADACFDKPVDLPALITFLRHLMGEETCDGSA